MSFPDESEILRFNRFLEDRKLTVAFAESMTAGFLSAALASVQGASSVLKGGVVCYDPALKVRLLRVRKETLDRYGAESAETTREMAEGLAALDTGADLVVAITGSASESVSAYSISAPAGSVFVCLGFQSHYSGVQAFFTGNRREVFSKTLIFVLDQIRAFVEKAFSGL